MVGDGRCFTWNVVGWWSYGVGNLKSTTSLPHVIEGSVFHVERGCVMCWGWGGVFMGAGLFRSFWFYGDVVVSRETWWVVGFYLVAVFHVERG